MELEENTRFVNKNEKLRALGGAHSSPVILLNTFPKIKWP